MKFLIIIIFISFSSFATISGSTYEARHQALIKKVVDKECGKMNELIELSSREVKNVIDQGQVDYVFYTTLKAIQKIDQGIEDEYQVEVVSERGDFYDHQAQAHGYYEVRTVKCALL